MFPWSIDLINSDNSIIFKLRNCGLDLKHNFVNNSIIWSIKNSNASNVCTEVQIILKKRRLCATIFTIYLGLLLTPAAAVDVSQTSNDEADPEMEEPELAPDDDCPTGPPKDEDDYGYDYEYQYDEE